MTKKKDGHHDICDPDTDPDCGMERVEEGSHCWRNFFWSHIEDRDS